MEVPYWIILPVVVGWLAVRHARSPTTSHRSKRVVTGLTAGAVVLLVAWSAAVVPVSLLLAGVGAYMLLHREMTSSE